ncbi:hypothetical protein C8F01DRAFT_1139441 [Mycena amicta]|nr:hypothetical protein C8F01DRAFT_1152288 [Mycena amicta]KAJ7061258.1 hypothetical protein C8F01DRAFT_1139441 [Mycena amicta]
MDYGLWIMDYGLWIMDYGLWIMDCGLWIWIMDFGFWIDPPEMRTKLAAFNSGDRAQEYDWDCKRQVSCNKCYVVSACINRSQSEGLRVVTQL